MANKMYAWSDLHLGGKTEERKTFDGRLRTVVLERNIIPRGDEVTKSKIGDDWDEFVANGSVRPYPLPEEADDYLSPNQAILQRFMKGGEIDVDALQSIAQPEPINPPADEGKTVEDTPKGT